MKERAIYAPSTAILIKILSLNMLKNEMEIPVFRTEVASKNTSGCVT